MSKSIQIAVTLPERDLRELDDLVPGQFSSRAAAVRQAVRSWLDGRRQREIDAALEAGYAALPQSDAERRWSELSVEALADADLDW